MCFMYDHSLSFLLVFSPNNSVIGIRMPTPKLWIVVIGKHPSSVQLVGVRPFE